MTFLLAGLLIWGRASAAMTLEDAYARQLIRTRRANDVERLRGQFDRVRVARLGCDWQMRRGTAPIECYTVLAAERTWRIVDPMNYQRRRHMLDAACARATLRLRVPETEAKSAAVSPECRRRVREAQLTRSYREDDRAWSGD